MSIQSIARVLIIDNDPRVGDDLEGILGKVGYQTKVVKGSDRSLLGQAVLDAFAFRPHVGIIDLRLLDDHSDDLSGLVLIKTLAPARCILYSGYLTFDSVRTALSHGIVSVVGKSESPQRLLDAVASAAREAHVRQTDFHINWPSAWKPQRIIESIFGSQADIPYRIVEEVIGLLFPKYKEIKLETVGGEVVSSVPVFHGRPVILKAWPDDLEPVVVKLAPAKQIGVEATNYRNYVQGRLVGRFYANLDRTVEFWDLGGTIYDFMGSSLRALPSFTAFYQKEKDPRAILRPLVHFFTNVWSRHYDQPLPRKHIPLFQVYDQTLHLEERLRRMGNQQERQTFPGLPLSLTNPVPWVLRHADDSLIPESRQAITHGDLHGDNLFVDGEHAWAIDFERTGPGHILRDFIELELDIVTRLASFPKHDLSRFYELAVILAEPSDPITPIRSTASLLAEPETRKALGVITDLRHLAYEVAHYRDFREYLWGLLFGALFVATRASEDTPQREPALLLGAVLCARLQRWGHEWPPKDWLPIARGQEDLQILDARSAKKKGVLAMLPPEQQAALMLLTEATKFFFSELGKKLDFWKQRKEEQTPRIIEPKPGSSAPIMKLDDLEQIVNTETLYEMQGSIKTSLDILRRLTKELDGHRKQLLTDTLLDPKTRAWLENKIPELEKAIEEETNRLQGLLDRVYGKQ